jgi:hypothetical protein
MLPQPHHPIRVPPHLRRRSLLLQLLGPLKRNQRSAVLSRTHGSDIVPSSKLISYQVVHIPYLLIFYISKCREIFNVVLMPLRNSERLKADSTTPRQSSTKRGSRFVLCIDILRPLLMASHQRRLNLVRRKGRASLIHIRILVTNNSIQLILSLLNLPSQALLV